MLATPLSRLNILCSCTECTTFLRPYPKDPPPIRLGSGIGFSLPPTPALIQTPTPHATPTLRPTAPTLAPSPHFLLIRPSPSKLKTSARAALPSISLSPTWRASELNRNKVSLASRSLWANISSPIDETENPISTRTPGLAPCTNTGCFQKIVPAFGRTVCKICEEDLCDAVLRLTVLLEGDTQSRTDGRLGSAGKPSRGDSLIVSSPEAALKGEEEAKAEWISESDKEEEEVQLFAVPSTPPSTKLMLIHSLNSTPRQNPARAEEEENKQETELTLFALPNTSLDARPYEEVTPTTRYAMHFPALPERSEARRTKEESSSTSKHTIGCIKQPLQPTSGVGSNANSKRSSREILTAVEPTQFSLHTSNASLKWELGER